VSLVVKICGLKTAADVEAVVSAGADAVGFVFAESVRRVTPTEAATACEGLGSDTLRVAVMKHPTKSDWQAVLESFRPDILQTDAEDYAGLDVPDTMRRWPVYRQGMIVDTEAMPREFLYEGPKSGAGETVDWSQAAEVARRGNMVLAGGLSAANISEAVQTARPWGVDTSSGVESAPGVKDPARIHEFVKAARAAEQTL
jgi:phosphoribosylanthranilate isomerase